MLDDLDRYKHIFDELIAMTDDGFVVVDRKGYITDINEQYCDFLGKTKQEAIGKNIKTLIVNTRMLDIMDLDRPYREDGMILNYLKGETKKEDNNFALISRACVCNDANKVIGGIAQVKFRLQTLDSAKKLMKEYSELQFYKEQYKNTGTERCSFDMIVGKSPSFMETKKAGIKAAKTEFSVLLTGKTGTGKEVFANAIHKSSRRENKPMVSINCAAIPSELLESELFGYEEGSFTGAKKGGKKGKFQLADGGTIFLDEIGDMPLNMQAKLLRVLQEKEIEKVGGEKPIPVDVRVISATRRDLPEMIKNGEFREDLYYRLNVINIEMVPLMERKEDIIGFTEHFLRNLNRDYKKDISISDEVKQCFLSYSWPGNIRELDNVIKSAYAACDEFLIELNDLPSKMVANHREKDIDHKLEDKKLSQIMDEYERSILIGVLKKHKWNCQSAADELGIHRSALYKKINKLNIKQGKEM